MPTAPCPAPATAQQRKRAKSKPIKPKKKGHAQRCPKDKTDPVTGRFLLLQGIKCAVYRLSEDEPEGLLHGFARIVSTVLFLNVFAECGDSTHPAEAGSARLLQSLHELREDDVRAACSCAAPVYQTRHSAGGRFAEKKRESKQTPLILFLPSFCFFLRLFFAEVD